MFSAASAGVVVEVAAAVEAPATTSEQPAPSAPATVPDRGAAPGHFADVSDVMTRKPTEQRNAARLAGLESGPTTVIGVQPVQSSWRSTGGSFVSGIMAGRSSSLAWVFSAQRASNVDLHRFQVSWLAEETNSQILKRVARQQRLTAQPDERYKR